MITRGVPFKHEAMAELAAQFPKLEIHMTFDEPLMELNGHFTAKDGAPTASVYRRYTGEEAIAMWGPPAPPANSPTTG